MSATFPFWRSSIVVVGAIGMLIVGSPALAFTLSAARPSDQYISTHYGSDEGLFADVVDKIERTPDGFLWLIVNGKGLARFDGRHFDLLMGHGATTLAVAPGGDLWIGTT